MTPTSQPSARVLFVCLGNICRSPAAEGVFRHQLAQAGLTERVLVDSAGPGSCRPRTSAASIWC
jgi:protein-tyrosine phosphatase